MTYNPEVHTKWGQEQIKRLCSYLNGYTKEELVALICDRVIGIDESPREALPTCLIFEIKHFTLNTIASTERPNIQQLQYVNTLPKKFADIDYSGIEFNFVKHYTEIRAKQICEVKEKVLRQIIPAHLTTEEDIRLWGMIHYVRFVIRTYEPGVEELWMEDRCIGKFIESFDEKTMTFTCTFELTTYRSFCEKPNQTNIGKSE